eukprot:PhM_4_TR2075/c4_g5_i1/m.7014
MSRRSTLPKPHAPSASHQRRRSTACSLPSGENASLETPQMVLSLPTHQDLEQLPSPSQSSLERATPRRTRRSFLDGSATATPRGGNKGGGGFPSPSNQPMSHAAQQLKMQQGLRVMFEVTQSLDKIRDVVMLMRKTSVFDVTDAVLREWAATMSAAIEHALDKLEGSSENLGEAHAARSRSSAHATPQQTLHHHPSLPLNEKGSIHRGQRTSSIKHKEAVNLDGTISSADALTRTFMSSTSRFIGGINNCGIVPLPQVKANIPRSILTSLYMSVEATVQQMRAERGILYLAPPDSFGELRAIVHVGRLVRGEERILDLMQHPAGVAFETGIMLNLSSGAELPDVTARKEKVKKRRSPAAAEATSSENDQDYELKRNVMTPGATSLEESLRQWSSLTVPIPSLESTRKRMGVLFILNKDNGAMNFDKDDESVVFGCAHLIAHLVTRQPYGDFLQHSLDVSVLGEDVVSLPRKQDTCGNAAPTIVSCRKQLVYSNAESPKMNVKLYSEATASAVPLTERTCLTEICGHMAELHKCWKDAVMLNMELTDELRERRAVMLKLKETLRVQKIRIEEFKKHKSNSSGGEGGGLLSRSFDFGSGSSMDVDANDIPPAELTQLLDDIEKRGGDGERKVSVVTAAPSHQEQNENAFASFDEDFHNLFGSPQTSKNSNHASLLSNNENGVLSVKVPGGVETSRRPTPPRTAPSGGGHGGSSSSIIKATSTVTRAVSNSAQKQQQQQQQQQKLSNLSVSL